MKREYSVLVFKTLQENALSNKALLKLNGFTGFSDPSDTGNASLEWESPNHRWHSKKIYKPIVSYEISNSDSVDEGSLFEGSNLDLLEWDNYCLSINQDK